MDIQKLKFHIEHDDYFVTLATIVDLKYQVIKKRKPEQDCKWMEKLRNELVYLQNNYRIVSRR